MNYKVVCPHCEWNIRCLDGNESAFECPSCGKSFVSLPIYDCEYEVNDQPLFDDDPIKPKHFLKAHNIESNNISEDSRLKPNALPGRLVAIISLACIFFLIGAALLVYSIQRNTIQRNSDKHARRLELQSVIKTMWIVCVATEQGVNKQDFRAFVRNALAEYRSISSYETSDIYPQTTESIEKAFKCWEGADYFWSIRGKFNYDNKPGDSDYSKLVMYIKEAFSDDTYKKLISAISADGGPTQFFFNVESIDSLISALFSSANSEVQAASYQIKKE